MLRYIQFYANQMTGLRTREWPLFLRLFQHIFLILCLIILLRSVNNGLLLSTYSPRVYPWYFMAEALLSFCLSLVYTRWAKPSWSLAQQQSLVLSVFAASIIFSRLGIFVGIRWVHFALPVICDALSAILLLQSWSLFSNLVTGRQAKRFFPLLGLGGTAGSILGGWLSAQAAGWVGTPNTLFFALLMMSAIAYTLRHIGQLPTVAPINADLPEMAAPTEARRHLKDALAPLFKHPLLLYVLGVLLTVRITSTLMDYQMQLQVKALNDQDAMTSYMGQFFALTSIFTLIVQLFLESRFIQRFGLIWGLASTPLALFMGTLIYMIHPSLLSISALKFTESLTRYSPFKTATELAYIPFEPRLRNNLRILTNGLLSVGTVPMISLAILVFAERMSVLIGLSLGFAGLGVYLSLLVARPYREKLQGSLAHKRLSSQYSPGLTHAFTRESLQSFFQSSRPVKVSFFLNHVLKQRIELPFLPWQHLLYSEDASVRELTWRLLYRFPDPEVLTLLPDLLTEERESRVQEAAIKALRRIGDDRLNALMLNWLPQVALRVQVECLVYLFACGGIEGILKGAEHLQHWIHHPTPRHRSAAAYTMGEIGIRFFRQDYLSLLQDPELSVRRACLRAARKEVPDSLLPLLVRQLADADLGVLGAESLKSLNIAQLEPACRSQLSFLRQHPASLKNLVILMGKFTDPLALKLMMDLFTEPDFSLKYCIVQHLSQLRQEHDLDLSHYYTPLQTQLSEEVYFGFLYLQVLYQIQEKLAHKPRFRFLHAEMERLYQQRVDMLFLLLGLLYPSYEMEQARQNYLSGDPHFRSLSLEVLNYTLESEWVAPITTLLDDISAGQKIRRAHENQWSENILDTPWQDHSFIHKHYWLAQLSQWCLSSPQELTMFPIIERMFVLQQSPLFARFGAEVLSQIAELCHHQRHPEGTPIFQEGEPSNAFYFIAKGQVDIYQQGRCIHTMNTFEGFGEIELLSECPRLSTVITTTKTELLCLQYQDFLDLMESYPQFSLSLLKSLAQRLSIQMGALSSSTPH